MKGIYLSADKVAALLEWAANSRREAEAQLAEVRAKRWGIIDANYLRRAGREPVQPGAVIDIREHIKKRYL